MVVSESSNSRSDTLPLVVRFGALGDMVLLTPLLRRLHQRYGRPCRVLGSGAWLAPLYTGNPDVAEVFALRSRKRPYWLDRSQQKLVKTLRKLPPGPVYICDDYARDKIRWLLDRAGVAPERCVYANPHCLLGEREHWIHRWLRFGAMTPPAFSSVQVPSDERGKAPEGERAPRLFVNDADRADLHAWLQRHALERAPLVLLQPGNKRTLKRGRAGQLGDDKAWPAERWVELIRQLLARDAGLRIILCGVPAEASVLRAIAGAADSDRVLEASNELPLRRLLALLERASGMISVDTGPAHAAAAMGCPLIVMYGAQTSAQWLPRSPTGSAVIGLGGLPQRNRVAQISLEEVLAAWDTLPLRSLPI